MKLKSILTLFLFLVSFLVSAQNKRYYDKIFTDVKKTADILYGSNFTYDATQGQVGLTQQNLFLDIYEPVGDTVTNRPLIIWAHGGSFLNGTRNDADIVFFCNEFAKRGFVTVSIQYRLGYEQPVDSVNATRTVFRALQDGRAAIRFMRSVAEQYKIDKKRVYFGGTSAGAFIALNVAFLNLPSEVPSFVDTTQRSVVNLFKGLGGIEGTTNNIKESSEIQGVINFCGATRFVSWMDDKFSSNVPVISMHGTADATVPYATRVINLNDLTPLPPEPAIPIIEVQGSYDIDRHAKKKGYSSVFYTWYGAPHVPYIRFNTSPAAALYMDSLMSFTVKHVYENFLGFGQVAGLTENAPPCDFNNGDKSPCKTTSVFNQLVLNDTRIYPNPVNNLLHVFFEDAKTTKLLASIYDLSGKKLFTRELNSGNTEEFNVSDLAPGYYTLQLQSGSKSSRQKIIITR